jgi:hypothetical protein
MLANIWAIFKKVSSNKKIAPYLAFIRERNLFSLLPRVGEGLRMRVVDLVIPNL